MAPTMLVLFSLSTAAVEKSLSYLNSQNGIKSLIEFSITYDEAKEIVTGHYPNPNTDAEVRQFIEERKIQRRIIDGREMFFSEFERKLFYRDLDLVKRNPDWAIHFSEAVGFVLAEYGRERQTGFAELSNPGTRISIH